MCLLGTDCVDCGFRTGGRRLALLEAASEVTTGARELEQIVVETAELTQQDAKTEREGVRELVDKDFEPLPGSRRLLKGGSSSSSSSSSTARWGSTTPQTYRAPGSTYGYQRSSSAIVLGSSLIVVRRGHYGCYACSGSQYQAQHSTCASRSACGHEESAPTTSDLDRYELDVSFETPSAGEWGTESYHAWPLRMQISSFTTWKPGLVDSSPLSSYVTFFTADGDSDSGTSILVFASYGNTAGFLGLVAISFIFVFKRKRQDIKIKNTSGQAPRPAPPAPPGQAAPMPTPRAMPMAAEIPMATATEIPMWATPRAIPMAVPVQGMPVVPSPQIMMPMVYPVQPVGMAVPTAYPSPPQSPPNEVATPHNKSV